MINVPMKSGSALNKQTISSINQQKIQEAYTSQSIQAVNRGPVANAVNTVTSVHSAVPDMQIPQLVKMVQKGQKVALEGVNGLSKIKVCLGWNVTNPECDVDVSAFLLNSGGKVIGDDWFVFYGQTNSPDNSMAFYEDSSTDREFITIDFSKLDHNVTKIVFVLTINEAFEKRLNFSMLKDAYIRILDSTTATEYVSFKMTDYYANVTSMMIGEIYLHNNNWKFNAIGNGVAKDLAGLCDLYGVQTI